jgi:hypothetical protein
MKRSTIPARSVALPVEHGAWGFLFEPLLAGMLLAPSASAPFILLFVVGSFLLRQPLKFYLGDLFSKKRLPRTNLARRFVLIFGAVAAVGLLGTLFLTSLHNLLPFAVAAPIVVYLISQDIARQTRELLPELLAAFALASSITVVALAGGFGTALAVSLWILMVARLIPSVLYIRTRLLLEKGKTFRRVGPIALHFAATAIVLALYYVGHASVLTTGMSAFLAARATYGLSGAAPAMSAKALGIREVVYGVIYALTIVVGYYLGI